MKKLISLPLCVALLIVCLPNSLRAQSAEDGFNPIADDSALCLAMQTNGQILVGGRFENLAEEAHGGLGRLNADGSLDTTFTNGTDHSRKVQHSMPARAGR
jgi:hypothetical protein